MHGLAPQPREPHVPTTLIRHIALADGRQVLMRPVHAQDAQAQQRFVRSLSPMSRLRRFHVGIRELAPDTLRALTDVDQRCHVAVVAQVLDELGEPTIVADARYVRGPGPDEAEFAVLVAEGWRCQGLAQELLHRLFRHARKHGLRRVHGDVLRDNTPMISLVRRMGGRFIASPGNAVLTRATFDLRETGALLQ